MAGLWVWIHRSNDADPSSDGVVFILNGENFTISKNVLQVAVPDEVNDYADEVKEISKGTYVMHLGGSKKNLSMVGMYKASDRSSLVSKYREMVRFFNDVKISDVVYVDVYSGDPRSSGSTLLYRYEGVIASVSFRWNSGIEDLLNINVQVYVGTVLG